VRQGASRDRARRAAADDHDLGLDQLVQWEWAAASCANMSGRTADKRR
jgi:hypothetical protein